ARGGRSFTSGGPRIQPILPSVRKPPEESPYLLVILDDGGLRSDLGKIVVDQASELVGAPAIEVRDSLPAPTDPAAPAPHVLVVAVIGRASPLSAQAIDTVTRALDC